MALPDGIGPHEGREFDLMRAGLKDVAYFGELEPEGLAEISADPSFFVMTFQSIETRGISAPCWIVYRAGFESQALRLKALCLNPPKGWSAYHEREVGQILGYAERDIQAFIDHVGAV